jgi:transketolase
MGSIMNGMALHGGVKHVGGTCFVFSDYMKPAIRLAALSKAPVIYSFTHDSIGLGEDGPTHQPIEHLAALRAVPDLVVIRPADANECSQALIYSLTHNGPVALILSRQAIPILDLPNDLETGKVRFGAYTLYESFGRSSGGQPDVIIIATGSEVGPSLEAAKLVSQEKYNVRMVSMPSWELFDQQGLKYQHSVLPKGIPTLSVEAGASFGWYRYASSSISIDRFGASAPGATNMEKFGFTPENIAKKALEIALPIS